MFSHWVISGVVDLGFQFGLYGQKAKKQAYNVNEELKTQICRFQIQCLATKEKSESLLQSNPNTAQHFTHIWSSRRQNDVKFGGWKDKTISNNFHADHLLKCCCDVAVAQINYPSFKHNTQDSIEQARGRSHEEVSSQIFMLYVM